MSKKMRSNILLLITAVIWGSAFVAQKAGASLEPFTYNGIRMFIGGLVLIPVIYVFKALSKDKEEAPKTEAELAAERKTLIVGGISCGVVLCIASTLQQFGLYFETSAGKAGFITSLYIVIVPVLGLFLRQKVKPIVWGCIVMGAFGFYLLTMAGKGEGFTIHTGELFVLICAVAFYCKIKG